MLYASKQRWSSTAGSLRHEGEALHLARIGAISPAGTRELEGIRRTRAHPLAVVARRRR